VHTLLQAGLTAHSSGDLERALAAYQGVLEHDPGQPDAWHLIGVARCQRGEFDAGLAALERAVRLRPAIAGFHASLARAQQDAGRLQLAAQSWARAAELEPATSAHHIALAVALRDSGDLAGAHDALDAAMRLGGGAAAAIELGALHLLAGRAADAHACFAKACDDARPQLRAFLGLGDACLALDEVAGAATAYERARALEPNSSGAHLGLGETARRAHRHADALAHFETAVASEPRNALARRRLGEALIAAGQPHRAIEVLSALALERPADAEALNALGIAEIAAGRPAAARDVLATAATLAPNEGRVWLNLAGALAAAGATVEADAAFVRAVELAPDQPHVRVGHLRHLMGLRRIDEAMRAVEAAVTALPGSAELWRTRGQAAFRAADATEALASFRRARALGASGAEVESETAAALNYVEGERNEAIAAAHAAFAAALPVATASRLRTRKARARARIGFVSADLRDHPVGRFLLPLGAARDRSRFEFVAYSTATGEDDPMTARLEASFDGWRRVASLERDALHAAIVDDDLDVLVDLGGLTEHHRLDVFAARAAPVQLSWLGYPTTTGIVAMDGRISDAHVDPPELDAVKFERVLRLPPPYLCFGAPDHAPEIAPLPARINGRVTFGSFNAAVKLTRECLTGWGEVLRAVPGAHLLLKAQALDHACTRARVLQGLADAGIGADQVTLRGWADSQAGHLASYEEVDVALDAYPYNGVTTTCEALWMGVPVLSRYGATPQSRQGLSLLAANGLDEFVAGDFAQLASRARSIVADLDALAALRKGLRARMQSSPLMDAAGFARAFESLLDAAMRTRSRD
jgi:predicted O-linked N-acetylglucosamine transferase (SPINDLY family)